MISRAPMIVALGLVAPLVSCSGGGPGDAKEVATTDAPIPLNELVLHPDRWVGKRVLVEGQLYKFPGERASSATVQDQLVCDRIDRFPPGGRGTHCIVFWGVHVEDVPGARQSPDGGWWVKRPVRLAGRLRGFPYPGPPVDRLGLAAAVRAEGPSG